MRLDAFLQMDITRLPKRALLAKRVAMRFPVNRDK